MFTDPIHFVTMQRTDNALRALVKLMVDATPHAHAVYHRNSPCCNSEVYSDRLKTIAEALEADRAD